MSDIVCDREFTISIGQQPKRVVVEWMRPKRWRGDWECEFVIYWPDRDVEVARGHGVDSAQALLLSMSMAAVILRLREVTWLDGAGGLGLPDPPRPLATETDLSADA